MKARRLLAAAAVLFCTARVQCQDWTRIGSEQGIEVSRRGVPGSRVVAFKGTGTIDAPLWKVAAILLDTRRAHEWADSLVESRVVERLRPDAYVEYNHIAMPFILKDREFVSEVSIQIDGAQKTVSLVYKPTTVEAGATRGRVRGEILSGTFRVQAVDRMRSALTAELQCDPKGAIPAWVANMFQKNWPIKTFEGLRAQAAKSDVDVPDAFKDLLAPVRRF
ncbi:MAG TPA: START domain-containing protein [Vicinamibacterales bacterium]|nr:START domain-containing protein [Vicinamibacterales bacterium]